MIIIHKRFFDVLSRAMIVALMEKRAHIHIVEVPQFEDTPNLLAIDNRGRTPLLIDDMYGNGCIIKEPMAAFEYIEDILPSPPLFPSGPVERAEVRAYCYELLGDFMPLLQKILAEKVYKVQYRTGPPETQILREIREETAVFMDIIGRQTIVSGHAIGNKISLADFIMGAQISILDYLDLISWDKQKGAKSYYRTLKQRPSFAPILNDVFIGIAPPEYYKEIDF